MGQAGEFFYEVVQATVHFLGTVIQLTGYAACSRCWVCTFVGHFLTPKISCRKEQGSAKLADTPLMVCYRPWLYRIIPPKVSM